MSHRTGGMLMITLGALLVSAPQFASCVVPMPAVASASTGDGGVPACRANPRVLPGSCGERTTDRYYCTICLDDERCISPKSTYCVARKLGCDDPLCK